MLSRYRALSIERECVVTLRNPRVSVRPNEIHTMRQIPRFLILMKHASCCADGRPDKRHEDREKKSPIGSSTRLFCRPVHANVVAFMQNDEHLDSRSSFMGAWGLKHLRRVQGVAPDGARYSRTHVWNQGLRVIDEEASTFCVRHSSWRRETGADGKGGV